MLTSDTRMEGRLEKTAKAIPTLRLLHPCTWTKAVKVACNVYKRRRAQRICGSRFRWWDSRLVRSKVWQAINALTTARLSPGKLHGYSCRISTSHRMGYKKVRPNTYSIWQFHKPSIIHTSRLKIKSNEEKRLPNALLLWKPRRVDSAAILGRNEIA